MVYDKLESNNCLLMFIEVKLGNFLVFEIRDIII